MSTPIELKKVHLIVRVLATVSSLLIAGSLLAVIFGEHYSGTHVGLPLELFFIVTAGYAFLGILTKRHFEKAVFFLSLLLCCLFLYQLYETISVGTFPRETALGLPPRVQLGGTYLFLVSLYAASAFLCMVAPIAKD